MKPQYIRFLLAILPLGMAGCSKSSAAPAAVAQAPTGVRAVVPQPKLDAEIMLATGTVYSQKEATLSAQTGGVLTHMAVNVGERVKKGQLLAQIDLKNATIALAQANAAKEAADAAFDGAQMDAERTRKLASTGSVPNATLEKAEIGLRQAAAQVGQAAAALQNAQKVRSDTAIKAPFDGVIISRSKNVGDFISSGTAVFTLVDTEALEVRVQVPEAVVDSIPMGGVLRGTLSASGGAFEAKVSSIGATVDMASRTVSLIADVLPTPGGLPVRPGALIQLELNAKEGAKLAGLFLPAQAVNAEGQEGFVWVVQEGKAARRQVAIRKVTPGIVRVESGIEPEMLIVADASLRLKDGELLHVIQ
ncbi:MAG: efflux RND transporter periplasmic adaptor subunit [Cystobacterineae bacterium]|nr:efflux RND transporter periplasmic adaptor subunit [Cystobacterineae bacterium]